MLAQKYQQKAEFLQVEGLTLTQNENQTGFTPVVPLFLDLFPSCHRT
jgi:hypothetical protein